MRIRGCSLCERRLRITWGLLMCTCEISSDNRPNSKPRCPIDNMFATPPGKGRNDNKCKQSQKSKWLTITIGVSEFRPSTLYHGDIGAHEESSSHFQNKVILCLNMVCVPIAMRSEALRSKFD